MDLTLDQTESGPFKYSCTQLRTMAPSPTAEATGFNDPRRTLPAEKTPGMLVSNLMFRVSMSRTVSRPRLMDTPRYDHTTKWVGHEQEEGPESVVREIKRKARRKYSPEEKIRIVPEGLRGEEGIAELCRREGINPNVY
jgi:hypothetical protein